MSPSSHPTFFGQQSYRGPSRGCHPSTTVLDLAGDNASNNDTTLEELVLLVPASAHLNLATRIRCLAHILNLAQPSEEENGAEMDAQPDLEYLQALEDVNKAVKASDAAAIEDLDIEELISERQLDIELTPAEDSEGLARSAWCAMAPLSLTGTALLIATSSLVIAFSTREPFESNLLRSPCPSTSRTEPRSACCAP
ncbi:hypothetical protein GGX14DRAFT_579166 [Mycena pura]|uniref:Uncharacterized protein n=1 Tax=Mycena pura TaxID=153505 RepID=A0AAD6XX76_9AGAR|nr:hypothetical protein GGX14DRAFT_579166 [Mycena pura]